MTHSIFKIQDDDSIKCRFYCIAFIEYMLSRKVSLDYTNLFFPNDYNNDKKTTYKYFKDKYVKSSG